MEKSEKPTYTTDQLEIAIQNAVDDYDYELTKLGLTLVDRNEMRIYNMKMFNAFLRQLFKKPKDWDIEW